MTLARVNVASSLAEAEDLTVWALPRGSIGAYWSFNLVSGATVTLADASVVAEAADIDS